MMVSLALRLLPIWNWLKRNPLLALCAILALYAGYQRHQAHKWHDRAEQIERASQAARKAQEALRAAEQAQYERKADEADKEHALAVADARDRTAAYIAAHRVRPSGQCPAVAVGQAGVAGVREEVPADSLVAVSEPDVHACTDATVYAVKLHNWALSITGDN